MFSPEHCGLIFNAQQIERARANRQKQPFELAWQYLLNTEPDTPLAQIQRNGLRWRFADDPQAGEAAVNGLDSFLYQTQLPKAPVERATILFAISQCIEMLRDHQVFTKSLDASAFSWLEQAFADQSADNANPIPTLWNAVAQVAASIVLEREDEFEAGTAIFRRVIAEEVHPEGYLTSGVDFPEAESLRNQVLAAQALTLIAEMAAQIGVDLWSFHQRGVSALTAVAYPLYYYFYPEQWPWNGEPYKPSDGVPLETAQSMFRERAGFLEIAGSRYEKPLKAIRMILDELRPVDDLSSGGLLTLAFAEPKPKRRLLFG